MVLNLAASAKRIKTLGQFWAESCIISVSNLQAMSHISDARVKFSFKKAHKPSFKRQFFSLSSTYQTGALTVL